MKFYLLSFFFLFTCLSTSAQTQLNIENGAHLVMENGSTLVLQQSDLNNNGSMAADGRLILRGNTDNSLMGSGSLELEDLVLDKATGNNFTAQQDLSVKDSLIFQGGNLELDNCLLALDATGTLAQENNQNRLTGSGGRIRLTNRNLPALATGVQPGNIGFSLDNNAATGIALDTIIRHTGTISLDGLPSIERWFYVKSASPLDNQGLSFSYFQNELSAGQQADETDMRFYQSNNGTTWAMDGSFSLTNTATGGAKDGGLSSSANRTYWSARPEPLPLPLLTFSVSCLGTSMEVLAKHDEGFQEIALQHAPQGENWMTVANAHAMGGETYLKHHNHEKGYYRLALRDWENRLVFGPASYLDCAQEKEAQPTVRRLANTDTYSIRFSGAQRPYQVVAPTSQVIQKGVAKQDFVVDLSQQAKGLYVLQLGVGKNQFNSLLVH